MKTLLIYLGNDPYTASLELTKTFVYEPIADAEFRAAAYIAQYKEHFNDHRCSAIRVVVLDDASGEIVPTILEDLRYPLKEKIIINVKARSTATATVKW